MKIIQYFILERVFFMNSNESKMGKIKELSKEDLDNIAGGLIVDCRSMANDVGPNCTIDGIKKYVIVDEKDGKVIGTADTFFGSVHVNQGYNSFSLDLDNVMSNSAMGKEFLSKFPVASGGSKFSEKFTVVGDDIFYKPLMKK